MIKKLKAYLQNYPEQIMISTLMGVALIEIIRIYQLYPRFWGLHSLRTYDSIFYFLPSSLSSSISTMYLLIACFFISFCTYFLTSYKKSSFSINALSFFFFISFYVVHIPYTDHRAGLPTFFYFIIWVPVLLDQKKWSDVIWKSLFLGVVIFYFLTGLHKLLVSGPSWANGSSLQIWFFYDSVERKKYVWPIMRNVKLAQNVQIIILLFEILTPLALIKFFRVIWLVGIILFHIGLELTFEYQYHYVGLLTSLTTLIAINNNLDFFKVSNKSPAKTQGKKLQF